MKRIFNFSAGPAMLPQSVLEQAQAEMLDWNGSGMSVMEMSHRGHEYMSIAAEAEADLREIMGIPANYKVLFLQGGASSQFAMIPQNLLRGKGTADYVDTGDWSDKAIMEAKRYGKVNVVASSKIGNYTSVPAFDTWTRDANAAYLHYTPNETIRGVEFGWIPETGDVPLVADMSSTILSRPLDVSKFGLIYAGAQKNIGPAGLTIVIVRDDLIGETLPGTPTMFDYKIHADNESMYNTPATYSWYLAGLVFKWIKQQGGLAGMATLNQRKAQKLYTAIETSGGFYHSPVATDCRSWMNVPFILANAELDKSFLSEAAQQGLMTLKGHRLFGGMRASLYNAMPEAGVDTLVSFMQDFAKKSG
ncbi:3-phosphoserine/phosphohydroxythreonine transaminase [Thiothrix lacustris]|uniref:3-phosphoserine/phosphohydroxythreonine transaminase n=1 Tax=Thiothrix lacustris TaxID=525917 RepID=UPI0027E5B5E5|nr:3-phosphoserine/phosphohydroxythreonine transaminase [Thiothrix lacustris]WMP17673.1 3-phosphoserine/phosphohydroxythreonine transaminase [Thiothrix lacustris]